MFHPPHKFIVQWTNDHPVEALVFLAWGFLMMVFTLWLMVDSP
jgi:hypothetical protein